MIKVWRFPIKLNCIVGNIALTDDAWLRKVDPKEVWYEFGYEKIEFKPLGNGRVGSSTLKRFSGSQIPEGLNERMIQEFSNEALELWDANYFLELRDKKSHLAYEIGLALKTFLSGSPTVWIGRCGTETAWLPFKSKFLDSQELKENMIDGFLEHYFKISSKKNLLFEKSIEIFEPAISVYSRGASLPLLNRFLNLMMVLELLYGRDTGSEISFRVSLSASKIISELNAGFNAKDIYSIIRSAYKIRNECVHQGKFENVTEDLCYSVYNIVFLSIKELVRVGDGDTFLFDRNIATFFKE